MKIAALVSLSNESSHSVAELEKLPITLLEMEIKLSSASSEHQGVVASQQSEMIKGKNRAIKLKVRGKRKTERLWESAGVHVD